MDPSGSKTPQQSLPAGASAGSAPTLRIEKPRGVQQGIPEAERAEIKAAYAVARIAAVLAALLLLVGTLNLAGAVNGSASPGNPAAWSRSLLALVLLFVATQLACLVLAEEHRASANTKERQGAARWRALWALRGGVLLAVAGAVLVSLRGQWSWGDAVLIGLVCELIAIAWFAWSVQATGGSGGSRAESQDGDGPPAGGPSAAAGGGSAGGETAVEHDPRLLAIGASGGGIRAAAFVLGGHQAVQETAPALGVDDPQQEPEMFAVSGGSYIGAAMALRRAFRVDGQLREEPTPWREAYAAGTPELERLRRHTRYLFEPTWRTRDGVISLVMGALVNLFILAIITRFTAWLAAFFAVNLDLVGDQLTDETRAEVLGLAPLWDDWVDWWPVLGIPVICVIGIGLLTVKSWRATGDFDTSSQGQETHEEAVKLLDLTATWRTILVFSGVGWLLVVLALPAAAVGLTRLTIENEPTTRTAAILRSAGFGTDTRCREAMKAALTEAVELAGDLARVSPGAEQAVDAGACGRDVTVKRTADPDTLVVVGPDPQAIDKVAASDSLPGQVAGVTALLALVAALLRRGPSPEAAVGAKWRVRAARALLTWLPLAVFALLATYLAILWTFEFLVRTQQSHLTWAVGLTVAACLLAALVDANATSMHGFYRSRLSDAFAVGVDAGGRAKELKRGSVYRFSGLQPRLRIVGTLNSGAANEAPTMRGGFPMVMGREHIEVHREEGRRVQVPTADYENFAGAGRVSIMAAVAISGAALSPLMGRYGAQMAPYRFLLTLFNVRVGAWVRNPMHTSAEAPVTPPWPNFLWVTAKPGLWQVGLEGIGKTSANYRWVYVSDGGHLDNTGLVECVRHCASRGTGGRVLILDASNDPVDTWSAVGDAIGVVRADLNIDLRRVRYEDQPPWMRRYEGGGLDVVVVKAVRTGPPAEDAEETDWWSVLPPNVQSFGLVNADFPRSSTLRQKFGDLEFEAYRGLGYASTRTALVAAGWVDDEA